MDPSLDPRLQSTPLSATTVQPNIQPFDQIKPANNAQNDRQDSPPSRQDSSVTASIATPQQGQHQHQYYGVSTPNSYDSAGAEGEQQTYPYGNGIQSYGVPPASSVHYGAPLPTVADVAADLKRPRACEACRQLKVKCEPDDVVAGTCRRCFRSGRQCVVTMPSRKRQKKTDSRVAELEKKIDALTASLQAQQSEPSTPDQPQSTPDVATQLHLAAVADTRASLYGTPNGQWNTPSTSLNNKTGRDSESSQHPGVSESKRKLPDDEDSAARPPSKGNGGMMPLFQGLFTFDTKEPENGYIDVIERGIIDAKAAYKCFDRYVRDMAPLLPFVVFPPNTSGEEIRKSKPALFLAIVSSSCHMVLPDLRSTLVAESARLYADRCICRGEKSLELVQAILVSTIWYAPPDRYEELNFNQLIHVAAVMAIDLGMGKRMKSGHMHTYNGPMDKKAFQRIPGPDSPETRRTWLGCYFMCANAAMSLRRPLLIRWTGYMDDSLSLLENSKDALPSDKWLIYMVKGQHLIEEVSFQFSMDDPTVEISITEPKVQYHLKAFERQLSEWRNTTPPDFQTPWFRHASNITSLYVHEIAMHHNHNIDDFKPPYAVHIESNSPEPSIISPAQIDALSVCIQSIHGAFDAMLSVDTGTVVALPTLAFVRTSYAAVAMIKLSSAISSSNRRFCEVFKQEDLKAEYYLDALIKHFRAAGENDRCQVALKFSFIFGMLRTWMQKRNEGDPKAAPPNSDGNQSSTGPKDGQIQSTTHQDPMSTQWSNTTSSQTLGANNGQSGLQMLSELASSSNNTHPDVSTASSMPLTQPILGWPQTYVGAPGFANDPLFGMMNVADMDVMGFDAEDWNAFNNVVTDPSWGYPFQQGNFAGTL